MVVFLFSCASAPESPPPVGSWLLVGWLVVRRIQGMKCKPGWSGVEAEKNGPWAVSSEQGRYSTAEKSNAFAGRPTARAAVETCSKIRFPGAQWTSV
ncbi:uncharacterized protein BKA78DRAFT_304507 [Phyllosticta capitalensis]|uniref:uncharacterized protein n=1 Tax=Phyllosticta capitalensis TaxID=121624 RepID=UPI00313283D4